jgi:hypothetical protein
VGYDCLLVYPIQRQHQADSIFKNELHDCYEHELGIRESWVLAFVVVAIPLLAYGFCRGITAMSLWVWRGFRENPSPNGESP